MKLSQATDYAFRAVLFLARLPKGQPVEAKVIADQERIPIRFLLKILRLLTAAGIVESFRGVGGGYALAREPHQITMQDVVEAVEGPPVVNRCLVAPEECSKNFTARCPLHKALLAIQQTLNRELAGYNFADLLKDQ
ncbi:RrF2 family transcriptional regulator [Desulforamulus hydrothermalis]|uniref:DNA-binding transcriptional regulator n=1 Tax=Desulforamulus hydrothermalis Lam5 = DSM 18033 TaxID=1121428 RepID=K8EFS1_9FIRM|nr:Rrf2 family transcriptional regulator [Desulforamulus hydrothermalis]CCO07541.1 DNA-binding transcriptional regulator [Desulforamulus hydrothermalis Lam5 = DSM 18033]SHH30971.1 transcriptional regulator, BadM/Rrf2 family [Desulforamulus hydrothermalis Lam5 = DSM 18033]